MIPQVHDFSENTLHTLFLISFEPDYRRKGGGVDCRGHPTVNTGKFGLRTLPVKSRAGTQPTR